MARPGSDKPLTFEEALAQLEAIVTAIEEGKIGLQDAIVEYEKGMKLIRHCRGILSDAETKINQDPAASGNRRRQTVGRPHVPADRRGRRIRKRRKVETPK
jgi:exodeoxyribonuclease VII small subunit